MSQPDSFLTIYRAYRALAATLPADAFDPLQSLGGRLLYAGEINAESTHLLYAANIAGAASIAASSSTDVQRQAIRDGVIDFLVTSLEEALRILKNEIRKRETVSVGVAVAERQLTDEMIVRGVLPDLLAVPQVQLFDAEQGRLKVFLGQGARMISSRRAAVITEDVFVTWSVDRQFTRWLPILDRCALALLPEDDHLRRRWLRLAPRYLGKPAQRAHGVGMSRSQVDLFKREAARLMSEAEADGAEKSELQIRIEDLD